MYFVPETRTIYSEQFVSFLLLLVCYQSVDVSIKSGHGRKKNIHHIIDIYNHDCILLYVHGYHGF